MRRLLLLLTAAALIGCGPAAAPEEEVTVEWTSGDDAPLEGEGD